MAQNGTALIWSPRSNITLYGDTARVTEARAPRRAIALGTDWMPSGSMNLLRELQLRRRAQQDLLRQLLHRRAALADGDANAAAVTATDDVIGILAPGKRRRHRDLRRRDAQAITAR